MGIQEETQILGKALELINKIKLSLIEVGLNTLEVALFFSLKIFKSKTIPDPIEEISFFLKKQI